MTTEIIEREAKLFEAGSYPDKGIEISEEDLDRLAASTSEAPIKIEHMDTPFDGAMGVLRSVYRRGRELFGKLHFTAAAWELVKAAGAKKLSVGIRKDKSGIHEVSLVRHPRVAGAVVFSDDVVRLNEVDFSMETEFSATIDPEVIHLRQELADREAQSIIDNLKREGKITPAAEVFAKAILRSDDSSVITFGDAPTPVGKIFKWFLDAQPKVVEFSELATADEEQSDEPEVFAKLGVTTKQVERYRLR